MLPAARALLDEFNQLIGPQKSALSVRLPQLFQQYYAPPAELSAPAAGANGSHPGGPGGAAVSKVPKRGAGEPMQPQDSKRLKQQPSSAVPLNDLERRQEALFKEVLNLLNKKLLQKKESAAFREPVDPIKLKIPDYLDVVKHPMDLGSVRTKLQKREYATPMEACNDVRQVWRNCATYNPIGHAVRKQGDMLADVWEKAWHESRIEERWAELLVEKDPTVSAQHQWAAGLGDMPGPGAACGARGRGGQAGLRRRPPAPRKQAAWARCQRQLAAAQPHSAPPRRRAPMRAAAGGPRRPPRDLPPPTAPAPGDLSSPRRPRQQHARAARAVGPSRGCCHHGRRHDGSAPCLTPHTPRRHALPALPPTPPTPCTGGQPRHAAQQPAQVGRHAHPAGQRGAGPRRHHVGP